MKVKNKIFNIFALLLLCIMLISVQSTLSAFAYYRDYTDALTDLSKDAEFNAEEYPDDPEDYSLKIIQIAESTDSELFIYTYQPCQKTTYLTATEINMSPSENVDDTKLYELTLLNCTGVFCKYAVKDFTVSKEATRNYSITSIYREWIKGIDKETGNNNEITAVSFPVGKCYTVETVDGKVTYSCKDIEVVEIKNPFVDFISYGTSGGWDLVFGVTNWTDIHYIAFSTDKKIDTLKEADVTYTTQSYHYKGAAGGTYTYGEKSEAQYITLTGKEELGVDGYPKYTWNSIYRSEEFVNKTSLTGEAKTNVENSEFVLVFLKTSFKEKSVSDLSYGHYKVADGTKVSDVAILRLMFETEGKTYNLGAIMDKQEGDFTAGNKPERIGFWAYVWRCIVRLFNGTATLSEKIVAIVAILFCLVLLPLIITILSILFPAFGAVIKWILKGLWLGIKYLFIGLWYIISAPFKLIARAIRKQRGEE